MGQTHFVPGTNPVRPGDIPGVSQEQPDQKVYVYVPFCYLNSALSLRAEGVFRGSSVRELTTQSRNEEAQREAIWELAVDF